MTPTNTTVSVAVMYFDANGQFVRSEVNANVSPDEYPVLVRRLGSGTDTALVLPSDSYPPQLVPPTYTQLELPL